MIELKKEFRKRGVDFKQIYKDSELAIYQTGFPSFEVMKVVIHKADKYHDEFSTKNAILNDVTNGYAGREILELLQNADDAYTKYIKT